MNIDSMFPSKYVKAEDLMNSDVPVRIASVALESVGDGDQRPVVYFAGMNKGLVLNRTNANRIKGTLGAETSQWVGQTITLYPSETEFRGETVPCIRVRANGAPTAQPQAAPAVPAAVQAAEPVAVTHTPDTSGAVRF